MKPALAQVATLNAPLATDIEDYAAAKCPAIEIWFGKLESHLESHSIEDVRQLLATHEMAAPVASFQGGLLAVDEDAARVAWEHFARRLDICQQLGIETIVVAADFAALPNQEDFDRVQQVLSRAAQAAEQHGVRLALEFQSTRPFCNNLQTALAVVDQVGHGSLGVCLDLFHYETGPSKLEDLAYLTKDNLVHVQLSDVALTTREMATDADRVLPGDGDFNVQPVVDHLQAIGYTGYVSIELMNPRIWQIAPLSYAEIAMTALRKILGQAET